MQFFFSNKKNILFVGLALLVILAIGVLIYTTRNSSTTEPQANANGVVEGIGEEENVNADVENPEGEEELAPAVSTVPEQDRPAAIERDKQRLADVKSLRDALAKFFNEKESYPEKLEELAPAYLSSIPVDPMGDQAKVPYTYTPIGSLPATYYDLGYYMEVGVEGLEPIEHDATPENLTIMQEL